MQIPTSVDPDPLVKAPTKVRANEPPHCGGDRDRLESRPATESAWCSGTGRRSRWETATGREPAAKTAPSAGLLVHFPLDETPARSSGVVNAAQLRQGNGERQARPRPGKVGRRSHSTAGRFVDLGRHRATSNAPTRSRSALGLSAATRRHRRSPAWTREPTARLRPAPERRQAPWPTSSTPGPANALHGGTEAAADYKPMAPRLRHVRRVEQGRGAQALRRWRTAEADRSRMAADRVEQTDERSDSWSAAEWPSSPLQRDASTTCGSTRRACVPPTYCAVVAGRPESRILAVDPAERAPAAA